jgi:hypothetical protein
LLVEWFPRVLDAAGFAEDVGTIVLSFRDREELYWIGLDVPIDGMVLLEILIDVFAGTFLKVD